MHEFLTGTQRASVVGVIGGGQLARMLLEASVPALADEVGTLRRDVVRLDAEVQAPLTEARTTSERSS